MDSIKISNLELYWGAAFDQMQDVVLFIDEQLHVLRHNPVWHNFFNTQLNQLHPHIYPEDLYLIVKALQMPKASVYSVRFIDAHGQLTWFELHLTPIQVANDARLIWLLIAKEQTHQVKLKSIQEGQQRVLKRLLTHMPIMLYRSRNNQDWTMEYVSDACERLTGHSEHALLNTPLYGQLIYPEDRQYVWENIQQALNEQRCFHIRYRLMYAPHQMHWVQEIGQGAYSQSGMVLGVDGMVFQTYSDMLGLDDFVYTQGCTHSEELPKI